VKERERTEPVNLQFMLMILIVLRSSDDTSIQKKIRIRRKSMKKPELRSQPGLLNYYPADAV
jgi:hypothetical protein